MTFSRLSSNLRTICCLAIVFLTLAGSLSVACAQDISTDAPSTVGPEIPPSPAPPAPNSPCNSACQSALGKQTIVDGFSGDSTGEGYWNQLASLRYNLSGYTVTSTSSTAPYWFANASSGSFPGPNVVNMTADSFFRLARNAFQPSLQNGFTIGMMVYVDNPSDTATNTYYSFSNGGSKWLIAERKGSSWGLHVASRAESTVDEYPWDANSFQTGAGWNYVFYTFTPDGKCRIDVFYNTAYYSALFDYGSMYDTALTSGTATSNPPQPPFVAKDSNSTYNILPGKGFEALIMFNAPLSPAEASGFYQTSYQGTYFERGGVACNTGFALNVTTVGSSPATPMPATPCGPVSNWSSTTSTDTVDDGTAITLPASSPSVEGAR